MMAQTVDVDLSGILGQLNAKSGKFLLLSHRIFFALEFGELLLADFNYHVQPWNPPVKGIANEEGSIEVAEGGFDEDVPVSTISKQSVDDLLADNRLGFSLLMPLAYFEYFSLLQNVPCVLHLLDFALLLDRFFLFYFRNCFFLLGNLLFWCLSLGRLGWYC
jgi:hypothetical protein